MAQRLGDVVNDFFGLWLVPKYVGQKEFGAILPLTQVGATLALFIAVIAITIAKYLNLFATRGEHGKGKALLRDTFCLAAFFFVATLV